MTFAMDLQKVELQLGALGYYLSDLVFGGIAIKSLSRKMSSAKRFNYNVKP
jgi:hypothetical protein